MKKSNPLIKNKINANTLKYIAVIAMLIDHIAWSFVPTASLLGFLMHTVGRLTAPIMCYMIAEGYYHTHNLKRYMLRLAVFAFISQFAYAYYESGTLLYKKLNMIFTLLMGLIALTLYNSNLKPFLKTVLIAAVVLMTGSAEWYYTAALWILCFGMFRGDLKKQMISFSVIAFAFALYANLKAFNIDIWYRQLFQFGTLLAIPLFYSYNGTMVKSKFSKWFFYIFYPAHLLLLGLLKFCK